MMKEDIIDVVCEFVGQEALKPVIYLMGKSNVSEFIIAEDLNMEIHEMRTILYKCYEHNILTFTRKKDKKKGWYICYWDFNVEQIPYLKRKKINEKITKLKKRLKHEKNGQFFLCKNACTRMGFSIATEFNFHCPECNEVMHQQDNSRTIEFLTTQLQELTCRAKS